MESKELKTLNLIHTQLLTIFNRQQTKTHFKSRQLLCGSEMWNSLLPDICARLLRLIPTIKHIHFVKFLTLPHVNVVLYIAFYLSVILPADGMHGLFVLCTINSAM